MPIPSPTAGAIQGLERRRRRFVLVNRVLCWILPITALGMVGDIARWSVGLRKPVEILQPDLKMLKEPLVNVPPLDLPSHLFEAPQTSPTQAAAGAPAVAVKEVSWKLKGVTTGQSRRAFLEDTEGKGVWVTEGEKIGDSLVKEIRERSVVLEEEGKEYELRL
jgi:hypothetical protein